MLIRLCPGFSGISERAKTRLQRSFSQSSNDSPKHIPNGESEQARDTDQQEQTSKNQSAPARQPNQKQKTETQSGKFGRSSFFDTLDWSEDSTANETTNAEPVQEMKQPTEAEESLLGNTSDDDDGFAALRVSDNISTTEKVVDNKGPSSNLLSNKPVHISKSESNILDVEKKSEDIDFLNINNDTSVNRSVDNIDLMKMEKDPSNIDLLSGNATVQSHSGPNDLFESSNDTFDPFQAFAAKKQEPPTVNVSKPKTENKFNSFDPFSSSSGGTSDHDFFGGLSSDTQDKQNTQSADGEDLMGSWDTHVAGFNNSPDISRNSSSSNIAGGGGGFPASSSGTFQVGGADIPRNSSGAFQQMGSGTFQMGGSNLPKAGSGTFQPMGSSMGASGNMPRANSAGAFQSKQGMGQAQGFGLKGQAGGKMDPFADLGKKFFVRLSCQSDKIV